MVKFNVWLKDFQHREIVRSENDSVLSGLAGTIIIRTTWPGTGQRNEENMYHDSAGRFGTIPCVCSYEVAGEHREAISHLSISWTPGRSGSRSSLMRGNWSSRPRVLDNCPVNGPTSCWVRPSSRSVSFQLTIFHAGWLSMYLHRDISLRNILMADEPVKMRRFEIPREFHDHLSSLQDQKAVDMVKGLCRQVEESWGFQTSTPHSSRTATTKHPGEMAGPRKVLGPSR